MDEMGNVNNLFKQMENLKNINDTLHNKIKKNFNELMTNSEKLNGAVFAKEIQKAQDLLERNKILSEKNVGYLDRQTAIVDEMDELKTKILIDNPEKTLRITVEGVVPFDEKHPFYKSVGFIEMLRDFYEDREEYELCSTIQDHLELVKQIN